MRKILIALITALMAASFCNTNLHAEQKDVALVLLENWNGERNLHQQSAPHESCVTLLIGLRNATKSGEEMRLTLELPPKATGKVLEVFCIRPDGSTQTNCDGTISRHSLPGYTAIANKGFGECMFSTNSSQGKQILTMCPMGSRCVVDALISKENRVKRYVIDTVLYVSRTD
jgi:hypothetical protein